MFNENTMRTISNFKILEIRNNYNNRLRLNKGFLQGPILYYFDINSTKNYRKSNHFHKNRINMNKRLKYVHRIVTSISWLDHMPCTLKKIVYIYFLICSIQFWDVILRTFKIDKSIFLVIAMSICSQILILVT